MAILYIYPASANTATLASEQILSIYVGWGDSIKQQNDGARVMKPEPSLRFPVVCPICAKEQLATFSIATLTRGLLSGKSIRLYAACHDKYWDATRIEKEQLREYLGALVDAPQPDQSDRDVDTAIRGIHPASGGGMQPQQPSK